VDVGTVSGVPVNYESIRHEPKTKQEKQTHHFKAKRCRERIWCRTSRYL
jgi:hypothetical protein